MDLANERQKSTQQSLIYNPDVLARTLSVDLVQELTNGFGLTVNRRYQTVARNDIEIAKQWFLQRVDATLAQAEESYWNLVSAQEQVKATQQELQAAQQLYENNKMREEVGTLAPLDVVTAQSQVASSQRDLIVAQTNLQEQELALKFFFSKKIAEAMGDAEESWPPILCQIRRTPMSPSRGSSIHRSAESAGSAASGEKPPERPGSPQGVAEVSQTYLQHFRNVCLWWHFRKSGWIPTPGGVPIVVAGGLAQELNQVVNFRAPEYAIGFDLSIPIKNRSALADNARASLSERQDKISFTKHPKPDHSRGALRQNQLDTGQGTGHGWGCGGREPQQANPGRGAEKVGGRTLHALQHNSGPEKPAPGPTGRSAELALSTPTRWWKWRDRPASL